MFEKIAQFLGIKAAPQEDFIRCKTIRPKVLRSQIKTIFDECLSRDV